jgi:hypothetical protein
MATAAPMPRVPPVTSAVSPSRENKLAIVDYETGVIRQLNGVGSKQWIVKSRVRNSEQLRFSQKELLLEESFALKSFDQRSHKT